MSRELDSDCVMIVVRLDLTLRFFPKVDTGYSMILFLKMQVCINCMSHVHSCAQYVPLPAFALSLLVLTTEKMVPQCPPC